VLNVSSWRFLVFSSGLYLNVCCTLYKFEFGNGQIRPPVLEVLLDEVVGLGLEGCGLVSITETGQAACVTHWTKSLTDFHIFLLLL